MSDPYSPASAFAGFLLDALGAGGVSHAVVSPGSRSQALALALVERDGAPRLHVRIDERDAAFTALGIGKETGSPAVVLCTSGTAAGNMLPAVMEASHAAVPLVVLTTDRPSELRGTAANQTTWQRGLFGRFVRLALDVEAPSGAPTDRESAMTLARRVLDAALGSAGGVPGPVHLNLQQREPLSGGVIGSNPDAPGLIWWEETPALALGDPRESSEALELRRGPRTVVVAGDGAGEGAEELAHRLRAPLLAEVSSGARFGRNLVPHYRELLARPELGPRIERVIVFGHPTLSREIPQLCERQDVELVVVTCRRAGRDGDAYDPGHRAARFAPAVTVADAGGEAADFEWFALWMAASHALVEAAESVPAHVAASASASTAARREYLRGEVTHLREPVTREMTARAVWAATWPHDRLVLGSSRMVRELDVIATGKKIRVHANRGLAGIDGTVATAVGVALASQDGAARGVTRVLLGDLTLLHDVGGLLLGEGEPAPNLQLVVVNDRGGSIFDTLEVAASARPDAFRRVMNTPHSVDLEALARAYGWRYTAVETRADLERTVTGTTTGLSLVEVRV